MTTCPYPYVDDATSKVCMLCHEKCAECNGTTEKHCTKCNAPSALYQSECVQYCPAGFFRNSLNRCEQCQPPCLTCQDSGSKCLTCNSPLVLHSSQCLSACPDSYFLHALGD